MLVSVGEGGAREEYEGEGECPPFRIGEAARWFESSCCVWILGGVVGETSLMGRASRGGEDDDNVEGVGRSSSEVMITGGGDML